MAQMIFLYSPDPTMASRQELEVLQVGRIGLLGVAVQADASHNLGGENQCLGNALKQLYCLVKRSLLFP